MGRVQQVSRSVFGEFVRTQTCPTLRRRRAARRARRAASAPARGRRIEERSLDVEIPAGIHDGQRIRISRRGARRRARRPRGDVYVGVRVRPDARFVREGNDIFSTVELTMTQAALGATVAVPTLDGEERVSFEPGTQPGEVLVLRGRGMPVLQGFGRGDHRVLVNVLVPAQLDDEQRRLLSEFAAARATSETYDGDEGFFDKLKSAFR